MLTKEFSCFLHTHLHKGVNDGWRAELPYTSFVVHLSGVAESEKNAFLERF